jgi:hypothetical protein
VGGGGGNSASAGEFATVGGGGGNNASGNHATIGGGWGNSASAARATIAGGGQTQGANPATGNRVTDDYGTVSGGGNNQAGNGDGDTTNAKFAAVGGGESNTASGRHGFVGGGFNNTVSGIGGTVGGGASNTASGTNPLGSFTTVSGGDSNSASGTEATVGGGGVATVPGGSLNTSAGNFSFAAGRRAKANHAGAFVWGDSTDADVTSAGANTFTARASGGVTFYSNSGATTGVNLPAGGGAFSSVSDRNAKENFADVNGRELLEKLSAIPLDTWNYRSQDASIRHMGPMAQDFRAAFGLGEDDKHISTVDADGVALAGVQALYRLLQEMEEQISEQQAQIRELRFEVAGLKTRLGVEISKSDPRP